jgi:hypothetical protein
MIEVLMYQINENKLDISNKQYLRQFYGGDKRRKHDIYQLIFEIYVDMVKNKNVSAELINKCSMTNRLDELFRKKNTHIVSSAYRMFEKRQIIINRLNYNWKTPILEDSTCKSCNVCIFQVVEYNNCHKCNNKICIKCTIHEGNNLCCNWCTDDISLNTMLVIDTTLKENILSKIETYRLRDIEKNGREGDLTVDDVVELIKRQNGKCYTCGQIVKLRNYHPYCHYQYSVDRLDNSKPHDKNNVAISCYYCNCQVVLSSQSGKQIKKDCGGKCPDATPKYIQISS